jgi:iron(III) transport system substrate-binding protein
MVCFKSCAHATPLLLAMLLLACSAPPAPANPTTAPTTVASAPGSTTAAVLTATPVAQPSATPATKAGRAELIQKAAAEGTLNVVSSGAVWNGTDGMKMIQEAFNATYNLNVTLNFVPGPSMSEGALRIAQETQAGQQSYTDVLAANGDSVLVAAPGSLSLPLALFPEVPKEASALDGHAIRMMSAFQGVTYNTQQVKAQDVPKTLNDLLDPKWKGKIITTSSAAGFNYLPFIIGEDRARAFVTQYAKQVGGLMRCGEEERVASGEFMLFAIDCGAYGAQQVAGRGAPVASQPLDDTGMMLHWYLTVPSTSAHPALSSLFSMFIATREGQDVLSKAALVSDYFIEGTPTNIVHKQLVAQGTRLLDADAAFTSQNRAKLADYMREFTALLSAG